MASTSVPVATRVKRECAGTPLSAAAPATVTGEVALWSLVKAGKAGRPQERGKRSGIRKPGNLPTQDI